jgi:polysaccharide biosynthesis protein PslH
MKILWAKTDFLHPTNRGGQIRTLEMLKQLHQYHEVHYVAFHDPANPEGLERSREYSTRAYPVSFQVLPKNSPRFAAQLMKGLVSPIPVAGMRYRSEEMRKAISRIVAEHHFDAKVCDFLFPAINIQNLSGWTLFQHNVESVIWERHAQRGRTPAHRAYFALQARRMRQWEQAVCRAVSQVIAVSDIDEAILRQRFGIERTAWVPTGVDVEYFKHPENSVLTNELVFVGSMDWMPNIDGIDWFLGEVFPLIRARKPECRLAIVGRNPPASLARATDPGVTLTGTVPDVRPYLWNSVLSIVPLRVGGGTRLKIFEAMAAGIPVVSTSIGAEGLPAVDGETILIADTAEDFADRCVRLLERPGEAAAISSKALQLIQSRFSWEQVARLFEAILSDSLVNSSPVPVR